MSDDLVKALLESLTPEQKQKLVHSLIESNESGEVPNLQLETAEQKTQVTETGSVRINEDFTVTQNSNLNKKGKRPVKWEKNNWLDTGENRDPDFDAEKFEKMGKSARNRGKSKKKMIECHVCGRSFSVNPKLIYGDFVRCNRCTGR